MCRRTNESASKVKAVVLIVVMDTPRAWSGRRARAVRRGVAGIATEETVAVRDAGNLVAGGSGRERHDATGTPRARFVAMRWHLLLTPPLDGADNMAIDAALMARARDLGEGVVRVYSWAEPTLSLGRNQYAQGTYSRERLGAQALHIVRRSTGGRAILHHREITYSVTAPAPPHESLARSYAAINTLLLDALRALGVAAELAPRGARMLPPGSAPCFERPAPGEVMLDGRKLVGSAQCREDGAMLQHGSILVHDDQWRVAQLAGVDQAPDAATLFGALGRAPAPDEFAEALFAGVRRAWDAHAAALAMDASLDRARCAARAHFLDEAWTWRR
jgi:lipoate-protein ligase A